MHGLRLDASDVSVRAGGREILAGVSLPALGEGYRS